MATPGPPRLDEKPSLDVLGALQTKDGHTINVFERISTDYEDFGIMLLEDKGGDLVENISDSSRNKPTYVTKEIVRKWRKGTGMKPVTWATLIKVLEKLGLSELADDIRKAPSLSNKLDEKPSLDVLGALHTKDGDTINVFEKISTDYEDFGIMLLEDKGGDLVENISDSSRNKPTYVTKEIVRKWRKGTGMKPVTWATLIKVLEKLGLSELADDIRGSLSVNESDGVTSTTTRSRGPGGPRGPKGKTLAKSPGLAVLFTCDYVDTNPKFKLNPLLGTRKDHEQMLETFDYLNYIVHDMHNPTGEQMREKLGEISDYLATYDGDDKEKVEKVIIFAFSGHGHSKGRIEKIFANDGEELEVEAQIVRYFTAHEGTFKIPKLFFIDACRGAEWLINSLDDATGDEAKESKSKEEPLGKGVTYALANYRIEYATIPHHQSYMDSVDKGSMWTPMMARALRKRNEPFEVISSGVQNEVFARFEKKKQVGQSVGQIVTVSPLYLQKQ